MTEVTPAGEPADAPLPHTSRFRRIAGFLVVALVLSAVALIVARNWNDFVESMRRLIGRSAR